MAAPEVKIIALSNIFSRMMFFKNKNHINKIKQKVKEIMKEENMEELFFLFKTETE